MKSRTLFSLCIVCLIAACNEAPEIVSSSANDGFSRKHEPIDANLDLRLGVQGDFSLESYTSAIRDASTYLSARSAPVGFDKEWNVEGPFTEGGRVNVLEIDPANPNIVYLGFSRGGLWKTTNKGADWLPISDQLPFPTVGAIALDTASSRIWIGTGDPNVSGYFYVGDGIYYSDDDGDTWIRSGLEETGIVSGLKIDPRDPNVLYASTMGRPYEASDDRGVYKSTDRGASWTQVLFDINTAGISAIHMDAKDPDILFATGWNRQRNLTSSTVFGDQSILWRSDDAGQTWTNLQPAVGYPLPSGRLGFAISPSNSDRLYLSVTNTGSQFGGFYRSDNGGIDWVRTAAQGEEATTGLDQTPLGGFGWFFGQTRVDPNDPDHVWMLGVRLWQSYDGGYTWTMDDETEDFFGTHADKHALEVGSDGEVWLGTDGGAYKRDLLSTDWIDTESIPTNMIYRVADTPFDTSTFACGMQDNGTSLGGDLEAPEAWDELFGGDGFQAVFNGPDTSSMLVETQNGRIWQLDLVDGFASSVDPFNASEERSWDSPIASLYDSLDEVTYLLTGSNIAHEGEYDVPPYWEPSQQVLTSDPDNRYYVITAAHISKTKTSYIGTSEGWLWKKEHLAAGDWTRINTGFSERYVTDITTAPDDPNAVYVTMSEYRNGNTSPYILRSADAGATWNSLQGDLPQIAVNSLLSIPNTNDSVLIAATDIGVYASVNRGYTYARLGTSMTNVPVFDLAYDPITSKLIAGTFGRSLQTYPLSSLEPVDTTSSSIKETAFAKTARTLIAYPNPTPGSICLEATLLEVTRGSRLDLLNLNGQVMQTWEFAAGQRKLKPCVEIKDEVANGQYIFRLKNRHDVQLAKVVLER
ncbi:MAG: WD40/YVTN/BNR-like repeat-containing protein [Saprospiraceae bacterium]